MNILLHRYRYLVLVTLIALLLRIGNPTFGSPVLYVLGDEVSNYMSAWNMLANKTLLNQVSPYPPLGSYIQIPFYILAFSVMKLSGNVNSIKDFALFMVTHEGILLFIPRLIAGLFGAATIPAIYILARLLFPHKKLAASWSSLFMTFAFIHIQVSHFARPWTSAVFFATLAAYFSFKSIMIKKYEMRSVILAAFFTVVTAGFLQSWFYALFLFLLVRLYGAYLSKWQKKSLILSATGTGIIIFGVAVFMHLTVYQLTLERAKTKYDWGVRGSLPLLTYLSHPSSISFPDAMIRSLTIDALYVYNFRQIATQEPLLLFFSLIALFQWKSWLGNMRLLSVYTLGLFFGTSILLDYHIRHLLPMWIGLVLLGGIGATLIQEKIVSVRNKQFYALIILFGISIIPIWWNLIYIRKPTFTLAREWLDQTITPESPLACLTNRYCGYTPTVNAISLMQQNDPGFYRNAFMLMKNTGQRENVRNMIFIERFPGQFYTDKYLAAYASFPFEYVFDAYYDPAMSLYRTMGPDKFILIKRFSPLLGSREPIPLENMINTMVHENVSDLLSKIERPGPYVDILQVRS